MEQVGVRDLKQNASQVLRASRAGSPWRSRSALHLQAARTFGRGLHALIAYDRRLIAAARDAGMPVAAPGLLP